LGKPMRNRRRVGWLHWLDARWSLTVSTQLRRGAAEVKVQHRPTRGELVETTLDRVVLDDLASSAPVREFRSYRGRKNYSG
jgi:hypothetical protein